MNAANEVAVAAFLAEQIGYLDIARCVEATMDAHEGAGVQVVESLEQLKAVDAWGPRLRKRVGPGAAELAAPPRKRSQRRLR